MGSDEAVYLALCGDENDYEELPSSPSSSSSTCRASGSSTSSPDDSKLKTNGFRITFPFSSGGCSANDSFPPSCPPHDAARTDQNRNNVDCDHQSTAASFGTTQDSARKKLEIKFKKLKRHISKMTENSEMSGLEAGRTLARVSESISERLSVPVSRVAEVFSSAKQGLFLREDTSKQHEQQEQSQTEPGFTREDHDEDECWSDSEFDDDLVVYVNTEDIMKIMSNDGEITQGTTQTSRELARHLMPLSDDGGRLRVEPESQRLRCMEEERKTSTDIHRRESDDTRRVDSEHQTPMSKVDLHDYAWYFGEANRQQSEQLLEKLHQEGGFLVRETKNGGFNSSHAISVYHSGAVYHLLIRNKPNNKFAIGIEKPDEQEFCAVSDLVIHHQLYPVYLMQPQSNSGGIILTSCPTEKPPHCYNF